MRRDDRAGGERLVEDFHQKDAEEMHFKETEEGCENMCEAVEKYAEEYAEEYAEKKMLEGVKNLMKSAHVSLEQAIQLLGLKGSTKEYILSQLQK